MGKKAEVVAKGEKRIFMDFVFPVVIKVGKDPSVLPQQTMDITYKII